jgi:hypothetical protein
MHTRTFASRTLLATALVIAAGACNPPDQFLPPGQAGGPEGVLGGSLTYEGPLPCTEDGHVLGAAVLLAFETNLLPPPRGLGTSAASLATVPGDTLFGGITDRLTFNADGSLWCPPASAAQVTVSGDWSIAPLPGGSYEVRGFYDLHGQFDPVFSITKLPHQGDIAGGAIDNVSAVLQGAEPVYRQITLGTPDGMGGYTIPPDGSNIEGIAVTLGLPLATGLPIFYSSAVSYSTSTCVGGVVQPAPATTADPNHVTMPSDYQLPVFSSNPAMLGPTEDSIIRVTLAAGVPTSEQATAAASPYDLPVANPAPQIAFSWQDVNGDGKLDIQHDHVPASALVPSLFPLGLFTKLASPTDDLTSQSSPVVVVQGLTLYKSLGDTVAWAFDPPANNLQEDTAVIVGIQPAVLCIDPTDTSPTATGTLVLTHSTDCGGQNPILTNQAATLAQLSAQFGRPIKFAEACLPQGRYAMNLVYGSGQAWTVPNEAGVCQALEPESPTNPTECVAAGPPGAQRTRLLSQDVVLTVGPPSDPSYCAAHPVPAECCPSGGCTSM